jgi:hypothetical protein
MQLQQYTRYSNSQLRSVWLGQDLLVKYVSTNPHITSMVMNTHSSAPRRKRSPDAFEHSRIIEETPRVEVCWDSGLMAIIVTWRHRRVRNRQIRRPDAHSVQFVYGRHWLSSGWGKISTEKSKVSAITMLARDHWHDRLWFRSIRLWKIDVGWVHVLWYVDEMSSAHVCQLCKFETSWVQCTYVSNAGELSAVCFSMRILFLVYSSDSSCVSYSEE